MFKFIKIYCLSIFISMMVIPSAFFVFMVRINNILNHIIISELIIPVAKFCNIYMPIINLLIMLFIALPLYYWFKKIEYRKEAVIFIYSQVATTISFSFAYWWFDLKRNNGFTILGVSFVVSAILQGFILGVIFKCLYLDFYGEKKNLY